jgi:hypothetical protein
LLVDVVAEVPCDGALFLVQLEVALVRQVHVTITCWHFQMSA